MKKFSLLLCCFVALLVSQKVWAGADLSEGDHTLTITTNAAGQVSDMVTVLSLSNEQKAAITKIVFDGKFSSADLSAVSNGSGFTGVSTVDMAEARIVSTNSWGNNTNLKFHTDEEANNFSPKPAIGTKAVIGGNLYQWTSTGRVWNNLAYDPGNAVYYATEADRNALTNTLDLGSNAKVPNSFVYRQMKAGGEKEWNFLSTSEPSGTVVDHTAIGDSWLECNLDTYKESTPDGTQIKVLRFFQLQEVNGNRQWVHVTPSTRPLDRENGEGGSDIVYVGEVVGADINNLDPKQGVLGSYIRFDVYYRLNQAIYTWSESTTDAPGSYIDGGFHDNDRESHKDYPDGQWVRMGSGDYAYSQLIDGGYSWGSEGSPLN